MHPILFHLFGHEVRTYSVAMAMGFVIAITLMRRRAPYEQIDVNLALNGTIAAIIGTLLGGRLMYVINVWSERFLPKGKTTGQVFGEAFHYLYSFDETYLKSLKTVLDIFAIWKGGLVFYGGFLAAIFLVFGYMRFIHMSTSRYTDLLAPYVGVGLAIHRSFGCYLNGCCYGGPTELPWGVAFPLNAAATETHGVDQFLHPSQIYMGISGLIIFFVLRWYRQYKKRHGEVFALLLMVYAFNRFIIEFFRGDPVRGHVPVARLPYLAVFAVGLGLFLLFRSLKTRRRILEWFAIALSIVGGFLGLFGTSSSSGLVTPFSTSQYIGFFVFLAGAAFFVFFRRFGIPVQPEYGQLLEEGALAPKPEPSPAS